MAWKHPPPPTQSKHIILASLWCSYLVTWISLDLFRHDWEMTRTHTHTKALRQYKNSRHWRTTIMKRNTALQIQAANWNQFLKHKEFPVLSHITCMTNMTAKRCKSEAKHACEESTRKNGMFTTVTGSKWIASAKQFNSKQPVSF